MAAVFLVTLYEYSPTFYISVVSLCFLVTAAMVLGWFGFDVPVILRSSDETESTLPTPEKTMIQVTNPFALELGSGPSSLSEGVAMQPRCLEPCVLSCFWGCGVNALQGALQAHQHGPRLSSPRLFQEALHFQYHHCQTFHIDDSDSEPRRSQMPAELGTSACLPRERYPLVAVLTLVEPEAREAYNIVSSVTVVHVPDQSYGLSSRILFQYLLTAQGNILSSCLGKGPGPEPRHRGPQTPTHKHRHCPICRAFVMESFALTHSDETESTLPTPEKTMIQVTNPFALELGSGPSSLSEGVAVQPRCLEPCVLSCFWGCGVNALQGALQAHQHGPRLSSPRLFQEALHFQYHHCQTFHIDDGDSEPRRTQMPAELGVRDFGLLPRERYPLVAVLTLVEPEAREAYNIVSSVTVVHVPDQSYGLSSRILFQYLLTAQGNILSSWTGAGSSTPGAPDPNPQAQSPAVPVDGEAAPTPEDTNDHEVEDTKEEEEEEEWRREGTGRDCVVCQNGAINRVLLPCRHACVCDACVSRFQHCPICRAFVMESFALT
ncbi:LOW QUALITY PROTEIN: hypothetical protein CRUP_037773, partial [Coryphaenoides rupestris]